MPVLYFVRHAQTEWNLQRRFQGQTGDSPLLQTSIDEISNLTTFLGDKNITKIYASPILRANKTAELINHQLLINQFEIDQRLKEINFGNWEGQLIDEIATKTPELYQNYKNRPEIFDFNQISGEGYRNVQERFESFEKHVLEDNPNNNSLIVSHGAALQAGISGILNKPLNKLKELGGLSNLSTTAVKIEDNQSVELLYWNRTDYLNTENDLNNTLQ